MGYNLPNGIIIDFFLPPPTPITLEEYLTSFSKRPKRNMTSQENVAGTLPARPPPHVFPSGVMEDCSHRVLVRVPWASLTGLAPWMKSLDKTLISLTTFLCIAGTDPLRETFHAWSVVLLGINLYLVPSLFCGGIGFLGQMRILKVTRHPPPFPVWWLSPLPSPNDNDSKGEYFFFCHLTRGAVVRLVLEAHQFCASILTIQTPWNANSTSKLLIPRNLLLSVFPWIYNALILKSPI